MTNLAASRRPSISHDAPPSADARRAYEDVLVRATRYARRFLAHNQAFELAHEVAVELLDRGVRQASPTLIYLRVTSRLLNQRRSADRRAVLDAAYLSMGPAGGQPPRPDTELEARELHARIDAAVATMPAGMRDVFVLVRVRERSYKEAAAELGVSVNTVHKQLSRANAILRECVRRYEGGSVGPNEVGRT
jgi:RNA polymerase sigma factor (sigma-70 family)